MKTIKKVPVINNSGAEENQRSVASDNTADLSKQESAVVDRGHRDVRYALSRVSGQDLVAIRTRQVLGDRFKEIKGGDNIVSANITFLLPIDVILPNSVSSTSSSGKRNQDLLESERAALIDRKDAYIKQKRADNVELKKSAVGSPDQFLAVAKRGGLLLESIINFTRRRRTTNREEVIVDSPTDEVSSDSKGETRIPSSDSSVSRSAVSPTDHLFQYNKGETDGTGFAGTSFKSENAKGYVPVAFGKVDLTSSWDPANAARMNIWNDYKATVIAGLDMARIQRETSRLAPKYLEDTMRKFESKTLPFDMQIVPPSEVLFKEPYKFDAQHRNHDRLAAWYVILGKVFPELLLSPVEWEPRSLTDMLAPALNDFSILGSVGDDDGTTGEDDEFGRIGLGAPLGKQPGLPFIAGGDVVERTSAYFAHLAVANSVLRDAKSGLEHVLLSDLERVRINSGFIMGSRKSASFDKYQPVVDFGSSLDSVVVTGFSKQVLAPRTIYMGAKWIKMLLGTAMGALTKKISRFGLRIMGDSIEQDALRIHALLSSGWKFVGSDFTSYDKTQSNRSVGLLLSTLFQNSPRLIRLMAISEVLSYYYCSLSGRSSDVMRLPGVGLYSGMTSTTVANSITNYLLSVLTSVAYIYGSDAVLNVRSLTLDDGQLEADPNRLLTSSETAKMVSMMRTARVWMSQRTFIRVLGDDKIELLHPSVDVDKWRMASVAVTPFIQKFEDDANPGFLKKTLGVDNASRLMPQIHTQFYSRFFGERTNPHVIASLLGCGSFISTWRPYMSERALMKILSLSHYYRVGQELTFTTSRAIEQYLVSPKGLDDIRRFSSSDTLGSKMDNLLRQMAYDPTFSRSSEKTWSAVMAGTLTRTQTQVDQVLLVYKELSKDVALLDDLRNAAGIEYDNRRAR